MSNYHMIDKRAHLLGGNVIHMYGGGAYRRQHHIRHEPVQHTVTLEYGDEPVIPRTQTKKKKDGSSVNDYLLPIAGLATAVGLGYLGYQNADTLSTIDYNSVLQGAKTVGSKALDVGKAGVGAVITTGAVLQGRQQIKNAMEQDAYERALKRRQKEIDESRANKSQLY